MQPSIRTSSIVAIAVLLALVVYPLTSGAFATSAKTVNGDVVGNMVCTNGIGRNVVLVFSAQMARGPATGDGTLVVYRHDPVSTYEIPLEITSGHINSQNIKLGGNMPEGFCAGLGTGEPATFTVKGECGEGVQLIVKTSDGATAELDGDVVCS